ncbi:hypothetical protein C1H46_029248 [Malus baccata]|uniref:Radical SAM core domain-containing protein n=1 Tax=Malus baccata TaxID=106549 RepID=A0A540LFC5_MALBA|nr:hypothetical protein C1H46_029248 [Malus baccata]
MMTASSTSLIQRVCAVPLARAARTRAMVAASMNMSTTSTTTTTTTTTTTAPSLAKRADPQVLLGLSEPELQQLAIDFSQQGYRGKQLHHLIYKRKIKDIQDFSQVPLAFRNELEEAGWKVGRSPIYQSVTAADGTVKLLIKLEDNRLIETVGIPVKDEKGVMRLTACVSSQLRETIVPSAKAYPLSALMRDCRDYFTETGRRVSFEYALLAGVNDAVDHAVELAEILHEWGRGSHVNLIPFNPIEGSEYKRPSKKAVQAFAAALENNKVTVSTRQTRGLDADAACGQLRNKFQKSPLPVDSDNLQTDEDAAVAVAC